MDADDMGTQSALLQELFGETVAKGAFAEQGRSIQEARSLQKVGVRSAGGVVSLAATAKASIPKNTFYGDRWKEKTAQG